MQKRSINQHVNNGVLGEVVGPFAFSPTQADRQTRGMVSRRCYSCGCRVLEIARHLEYSHTPPAGGRRYGACAFFFTCSAYDPCLHRSLSLWLVSLVRAKRAWLAATDPDRSWSQKFTEVEVFRV